jgi:hypothetical protein
LRVHAPGIRICYLLEFIALIQTIHGRCMSAMRERQAAYHDMFAVTPHLLLKIRSKNTSAGLFVY